MGDWLGDVLKTPHDPDVAVHGLGAPEGRVMTLRAQPGGGPG